MKLTNLALARINAQLPIDVVKALEANSLSVVDIHKIVAKELSKKEPALDTSELCEELNTLINSFKNKKYSIYFHDLKSHKAEFLHLLAKGILKNEITKEQVAAQFDKFWHSDHSLLAILQELGYANQACLMKFIGIQNDGMITLTREQKYIAELCTWKKEKKFEQLTDIEDCYFWCMSTFTNAGKSLGIVVKWLAKFIENSERIAGRLVYKDSVSEPVDETMYFLKEYGKNN